MKKSIIMIPLLAIAVLITSCSNGEQTTNEQGTTNEQSDDTPKGQSTVMDDESTPNVLQVAIGSPDHTTLVAAVQAAELQDVLANNGPFTVFAPTNDAFDALPEGTVEDLLKPENKAKLARIITYHAAPGIYKDNLLNDGRMLYQATGHYVKIENKEGVVTVEGAKILGSVDAANGVVHVVDKVLLPPDL